MSCSDDWNNWWFSHDYSWSQDSEPEYYVSNGNIYYCSDSSRYVFNEGWQFDNFHSSCSEDSDVSDNWWVDYYSWIDDNGTLYEPDYYVEHGLIYACNDDLKYVFSKSFEWLQVAYCA